jgi:hypothetical protein
MSFLTIRESHFAGLFARMNTLRLIITTCCCLIFSGTARARNLTEAEARNLVVVSLGKDVSGLPHFGMDLNEDPTAADFYVFDATADHPNGGSPVIGQFAVYKATGDVWRMGICERAQSKSLANAQRAIRKKIGISQAEFRRLTTRAPCQP